MRLAADDPGLYIHVPFCARACPYCDFDFEVPGKRELPARVDAWLEGLEAEVLARGLSGPLRTLYLGGGTPSALGAEGLERVFSWIDSRFDRRGVIETTVELNPEHVQPELLLALQRVGVGRVSLGVQSLASGGLSELGRVHDVARARQAIAACVKKFETSVDLILGWTGQRFDGAAGGLREALEFADGSGIAHLSLYALTIEQGSAWPGLVRRGLRQEPDEEAQAEVLNQAERWLVDHGWDHYEVSSYARGGQLAQHNRAYWTWRDYWGIGPSASSASYDRDASGGSVARRTNPRGLDAWLSGVRLKGSEAFEVELLRGEAAAGEALWLGLRRLGGIELAEFFTRFTQVDLGWLKRRIDRQLELGNLEYCDDKRALRVAPGRWAWHDSIAIDLVASDADSG